jgi:predicted O-methyltransferase YrrM
MLRFLATLLEARAIVEIGTGTGALGCGCCGVAPGGVLTTVDVEAEHQRLARQAFHRGQVLPTSASGSSPAAALEVLPRLTDGHYDLVFCDGAKRSTAILRQALRLLRQGG